MYFVNCALYNVVRKRDLCKLLHCSLEVVRHCTNDYKPYIDKRGKKRLVEPTYSNTLKNLHGSIYVYLSELVFEDNVFGGIKGKSYLDNGIYHLGNDYVVALDISKFFPSISREKIYQFFRTKLLCSPDVSKILTDLCSINIEIFDESEVTEFLSENGVKTLKHLPTGAPFSSVLAYLVNIDMFNEITSACQKKGYKVSFYIDDIVVSSKQKITRKELNSIVWIIKKHGYRLQVAKSKKYYKNQYKRVTGAIISRNAKRLVPANKITYKMRKLKKDTLLSETKKEMKFRGLSQVLKQTEKKNEELIQRG